MSSKKKLVISMLVVSFVLLSIIATVAIAFALTQQTIKTSLNIGYTVEDIDGTASATYTIGGVTEKLTAMKGENVIGDTLVFKAGDTENAGNLMFPEDALALSAQNDNVVIQYTYSNTGSKHYIASMDFNANITANNMKVEYSIDGVSYSENRYAVVVPANTANRSYWIKISIDNKAASASFTGDFDWLLSGCDPQSESYLSMPKLEFQGSNGSYSANIASNSGYVGNLVFPSEVNGDPVTTIVASSLTDAQKQQVTSVYIPDSVTTIGDNAFNGYTNLETVTFEQNTSMATADAYSGTGLQTIGLWAFEACYDLKEIQIPNTVKEIQISAFRSAGLTEIEIPASVTTFSRAFEGCSDLKKFTINSGDYDVVSEVKQIASENGGMHLTVNDGFIDMDTFLNFAGLETLELNVNIDTYNFNNCNDLKRVIFGKNVTSISRETRFRSPNIESLEVSSENGTYYSENNCIITKSTKELVMGCNASVIPNGVKIIGQYAFSYCKGLKSITIPESVNSIYSEDSPDARVAFMDCESLENIVVDSSNKTFKSVNNCLINISTKRLVLGCKNSVIPTDGSVTSIGSYAFGGCTGLTTIIIPEAVVRFCCCAFSGCTGLTSLTFEITTGWAYSGFPIESSQLEDPADAANYLKSNLTYPWTRSEAE